MVKMRLLLFSTIGLSSLLLVLLCSPTFAVPVLDLDYQSSSQLDTDLAAALVLLNKGEFEQAIKRTTQY
jgi:hypothetical protein